MSESSTSVSAPSVWSVGDRSRLQTFLTSELGKVVKNAEFLNKMVAPAAMEIWEAAFTHSSITSIPGQNYEWLETLGDKYLGAIFLSYVGTILPRDSRTPSYYTELVRYWLGKEQLAKFSAELKLPLHVKVLPEVLNDPDPRMRDTVYEDVFEAFVGALVTVGDSQIKDMVGVSYAKLYLFQFLKNKNILLSEDEIFPPKTKLKELFDGLRWGDVRYVLTGRPNDPQVTISVLDFQGDRLASGKGRDRPDAEKEAAISAIKVLANQKITASTIAAAKPVDKEVEALKARISRYLEKYGKYGSLEFVRIYKESGKIGKRIVELRTTQDYETPNARLVALSRGSGVQERQARISALQQYMNTHGIA